MKFEISDSTLKTHVFLVCLIEICEQLNIYHEKNVFLLDSNLNDSVFYDKVPYFFILISMKTFI